MKKMELKPGELDIMKKIMPLICLIIPWEVYFYSNYSSGWGIKLSVFYVNFDDIYGTIFVNLFQQMSLLSNGGFLPSVRTLGWIFAAILCIALAIYELLRENIEIELETKTTAQIIIACGILTTLSSIAVWNNSFKTLPIAPVFFFSFGYLLLHSDRKTN
jgi:hypothetical protein